jgi:hypothetical protein
VFYAAYVYIAPPIMEAIAARTTPAGEKQPIAGFGGVCGGGAATAGGITLTRNPRVVFTFIGCVVVFYTLFAARMKCE